MNKRLDILKEELTKIGNTDNGSSCEAFCEALAAFPKNYYDNIFFPEKIEGVPVIITDIQIKEGNVTYLARPQKTGVAKKTYTLDSVPEIAADIARNIVSAVEVAIITKKEVRRGQREIERRKKEIEKAQTRKAQ